MKLDWNVQNEAFRAQLAALQKMPKGKVVAEAIKLANTQLDFVSTNRLDSVLNGIFDAEVLASLDTRPVRLAILSSSTTTHLHSGIRVAGIRRGIHIEIYEGEYGQYWQELSSPAGALHQFKPTAILLSLDAHHLAAPVHVGMSSEALGRTLEETQDLIRRCWQMAHELFDPHVIHQTSLPLHITLMGNNEHRLPGSKALFIERLNAALPVQADKAGVDLIAIDRRTARDGLDVWHDLGLWHKAKQEISPKAAPLYGDLVGRLVAARQGRSYKCLIMDLDNTLWGGVVGDDGLQGIVLGQGSALGEAFVAFQSYARDLSRRGVILAVCSKNDEANAVEPFDSHPEMILRRTDLAAFVCNWCDKATNIRKISTQLNIGLDSIVFIDDNPFERNLVRQELPMVAVPEVGEDPADFARILADAGYFESLSLTSDDLERSRQYQSNLMRETTRELASDMPSYLRSLKMDLIVRRFDTISLSRIVQLINKTNQFNLTTRRYTNSDVAEIMNDDGAFGLQFRLIDKFGDNGIISIVIGRLVNGPGDLGADIEIDTWLMSCRVLGREVEVATLNVVVEYAKSIGAKRLLGRYVSTKKNGMVKDHYKRLGFSIVQEDEDSNSAILELASFKSNASVIKITREEV